MPSEASPAPSFICRIPAELLPQDEKQRRFYTQSDVMDQKMDWLLSHSLAQAETLEDVRVQCRATNGRVLAAEGEIRGLKTAVGEQLAATAPVVKAYGYAGRAVRSKIFWCSAAVFVFVVMPMLMSVAPAPLVVLKAVGGVIGGMLLGG